MFFYVLFFPIKAHNPLQEKQKYKPTEWFFLNHQHHHYHHHHHLHLHLLYNDSFISIFKSTNDPFTDTHQNYLRMRVFLFCMCVVRLCFLHLLACLFVCLFICLFVTDSWSQIYIWFVCLFASLFWFLFCSLKGGGEQILTRIHKRCMQNSVSDYNSRWGQHVNACILHVFILLGGFLDQMDLWRKTD